MWISSSLITVILCTQYITIKFEYVWLVPFIAPSKCMLSREVRWSTCSYGNKNEEKKWKSNTSKLRNAYLVTLLYSHYSVYDTIDLCTVSFLNATSPSQFKHFILFLSQSESAWTCSTATATTTMTTATTFVNNDVLLSPRILKAVQDVLHVLHVLDALFHHDQAVLDSVAL